MALSIQIWTTGEPVPEAFDARGRFFAMFERALCEAGLEADLRGGHLELTNIEAVSREELPELGSSDAVIITGSPAFLREEQPWMQRLCAKTRELVEANIPTLGVCFGHQILGEALGGYVEKNPRGREIGTVEFRVERDDPLFPTEDGSNRGWVQMSHLDSVTRLPPGAEVLGSTALEPYAAVRFSEWAWGVQFHPEMDAEIVRHYLAARAAALLVEGLDAPALVAATRESSYGSRLLEQFIRLSAARKSARI